MLLFAALVGILTYLLVDVPIFVETMGLLAVLTEAMLGIPQFLRNVSNKSTNGMRYKITLTIKNSYFNQFLSGR